MICSKPISLVAPTTVPPLVTTIISPPRATYEDDLENRLHKESDINTNDVDNVFLVINKHMIPINTINNIMVNDRMEVVIEVHSLNKNGLKIMLSHFMSVTNT